MHCGVMVTGYNQGDWERLMAEDYEPPARRSRTPRTWTTRSTWASSSSRSGSTRSGPPSTTARPTRCSRTRLQYLAYWAGRTRRVDVGTAVIVAPWWNPVRLASEISMLDILLKGRRLHLGHRARHRSPRVRLARLSRSEQSHAYFYDVDRRPPGGRRRRALHLRRQGLQDPADHHPPPGAAQGRSHHAHQGGVHHRGLRADGRRERARADVRRRRRASTR